MSRRQGVVRAFLWYVAVVAIALGSAGLIVDLDRPATAGSRPELTARGHALVAAAIPELGRLAVGLSAQVDGLSRAAGEAFEAVDAGDPALAREELAAGSTALAGVSAAASDLRGRLMALDEVLGAAPIDDAQRARLAALADALAAADGLPATWDRFADEGTRIVKLLERGSGTSEPSAVLVDGLVGIDRVRGAISGAVAALD